MSTGQKPNQPFHIVVYKKNIKWGISFSLVKWSCSRKSFLARGLWRSCSHHSLHSLTGPVGQPFASPSMGQSFAPRGGNSHLHWNWEFLLALSCYIGDPDVIIDHRPQLQARFTEFHSLTAGLRWAQPISSSPQLYTPVRARSAIQQHTG
jgi:hypothetical protein